MFKWSENNDEVCSEHIEDIASRSQPTKKLRVSPGRLRISVNQFTVGALRKYTYDLPKQNVYYGQEIKKA